MGADKATLDLGGSPMVARVVEALGGLTSVTIIGGSFDEHVAPTARRCLDRYPGEGPLGALITGFHVTNAPVVFAAACDLPKLSELVVAQLVRARAADDADVCVPLVDGRLQWHVASWHRRALEELENTFASGERALFRAARRLSITALVPPRPEELVDIDTPAAYEAHRPR